jgi:LysM repeat protein
VFAPSAVGLVSVYETLIKLCTDICKRNGKIKLLWLGDKDKTLNYSPKADEMLLTVHRWFANKSCPGNRLYARLGDLAAKVTEALGGDTKTAESARPAVSAVKAGDHVKITGAKYYGGQTIPSWVKAKNWIVHSVSGNRAVINKSEDGKNAIMSPVKVSDLALVTAKAEETYRVHTVVHGDTLWAISQKYLGIPAMSYRLKHHILMVAHQHLCIGHFHDSP